MGLAWQQGPLATGSVGHFLTEQPLPPRLLFAEPLRRRMRVRFADRWIADSEDVILLHEPGRYPVAYFPLGDIEAGILIAEDRVTQHHDLGDTQWFTVKVRGAGGQSQRVATHGVAATCGGSRRAAGIRLARHGRLLRRRRTHRRACRRCLSPHRYPFYFTASRRPGRRAADRRHTAPAGAVRIGLCTPLVRTARRYRRIVAQTR